ncbi:uncharacterized protein LOC126570301 isoform X2 [Anopheles aquasalis]|uniref:uncharacterized protein LOC126570301 isoform X2 n=1 Tax=Anopheles aquasalis TaxID=42839 RepID=UPI00215AEAB4|nr:uncharacterized protein LOC126570301 isoform X2 [Anopheles aquasalis]
MPRRKPITKLGVFGKYDLNPEKAVENYFESKFNSKFYTNVPGWDVARNGFELKGIHNDREYMEISKEQHRMREQSQRQAAINRRRLQQTNQLLEQMRDEFVELNEFLKDCEMKENNALDTVKREQEKHEQYGKKIAQLEDDIEKLDDFVLKYEKTINTFEPYEQVMEQTIAESKTYETMQDLIQRCDSLHTVHGRQGGGLALGKVRQRRQELHGGERGQCELSAGCDQPRVHPVAQTARFTPEGTAGRCRSAARSHKGRDRDPARGSAVGRCQTGARWSQLACGEGHRTTPWWRRLVNWLTNSTVRDEERWECFKSGLDFI